MEEDITIIMRGGAAYQGGPNAAPGPVDAPDGYILERVLGRGGMGSVYLARRLEDGKQVALKVLDPELASKEKVSERFRREARLMIELDHPNIIKAFSVGMRGNCYYLCMEYVPGETLGALIRRRERLDQFEALRMMRQLGDAIAYGAKVGLVHRDFKPENIIIREDGIVKLADMGLAILSTREDLRLTAAGTTLGTPLYMSPEQARGEREIDTRADVYSLGCTFYHALCGQPPFPGDDGLKVMRAHLHDEAVRPRKLRPDLREDVEAIVLKCMQKAPERRYQTGADLVQTIDLIMLAAGQDIAPSPLKKITKLPAEGSPKTAGDAAKIPLADRFSDDEHFSFGSSGSA